MHKASSFLPPTQNNSCITRSAGISLCLLFITGLADYPIQCILALIVLPPALWVWYMGMPFVAHWNPSIGWGSVVLGILPLVVRGRPGEARA